MIFSKAPLDACDGAPEHIRDDICHDGAFLAHDDPHREEVKA
jgi:hypothetical protein